MSLSVALLLLAGGGGIGFLLAVLGAGGSVLLLPLLVSGAGLSTRDAVPLSLLVVTLLALGNLGPCLRRRQLAPAAAVILGAPALLGSWIGGRLVRAGLVPEALQLLLFTAAALLASWLMTRPATSRPRGAVPAPAPPPAAGAVGPSAVPPQAPARSLPGHRSGGPASGGDPPAAVRPGHRPAPFRAPTAASPRPRRRTGLLALQGLLVGLLTGLAGVGGGFAIVPALVLLAGLPMPLASGTSLLLIPLNSLVALAALGHWPRAAMLLLIPLSAGGFLGAWLGQRLAPRLRESSLRRGFALLLLGSALLSAGEAWRRQPSEPQGAGAPPVRAAAARSSR
ncbi:MAG: sulfite exporter TauE/SafE family protein [Synechococcaceae cyanobacterium]|nr:sulfite exporter TauE/SafE family protein [Synechococcaceae cyanobacterium]